MKEVIQELANFFSIDLRGRWTDEKPHPALNALIAAQQERYVETLGGFVADAARMADIASDANDPLTPRWNNEWITGLDVISLYGYVKRQRPSIYLEIGSGNSTMFVRQAIRDHDLPTRILSIDPQPRAKIDQVCDEIFRQRLEHIAWEPIFSRLTANDVIFFDGSHRCFPNTDVTVFFTEILPSLPSGVLIGIHDIFLPSDYTKSGLDRFYSEQYLLACWLLADNAHRLRIELPACWIGTSPQAAPSRAAIAPLYKTLPAGVPLGGGAFWISKK